MLPAGLGLQWVCPAAPWCCEKEASHAPDQAAPRSGQCLLYDPVGYRLDCAHHGNWNHGGLRWIVRLSCGNERGASSDSCPARLTPRLAGQRASPHGWLLVVPCHGADRAGKRAIYRWTELCCHLTTRKPKTAKASTPHNQLHDNRTIPPWEPPSAYRAQFPLPKPLSPNGIVQILEAVNSSRRSVEAKIDAVEVGSLCEYHYWLWSWDLTSDFHSLRHALHHGHKEFGIATHSVLGAHHALTLSLFPASLHAITMFHTHHLTNCLPTTTIR
ncbi:hypothetical protein NDU88_001549 [Pleurodeles waltl]|uniref:Uncharacterized protein n=1 Tax=Pleurodeles waltl TaxID=8319 RepID=A0AAV7T0U8_PLEWA|nr:hypothetical protein NDU88_001549 [Pleurodeles waltl]